MNGLVNTIKYFKQIKTWVVSTDAPTDTNVGWVDSSSNPWALKLYQDGEWNDLISVDLSGFMPKTGATVNGPISITSVVGNNSAGVDIDGEAGINISFNASPIYSELYFSRTGIDVELTDNTNPELSITQYFKIDTEDGIIIESPKGSHLYNVVLPTNPGDATNKQYVDNLVKDSIEPLFIRGSLEPSGFVPDSGQPSYAEALSVYKSGRRVVLVDASQSIYEDVIQYNELAGSLKTIDSEWTNI